jgi:ELWxxDGT repeat protein
VLVKDIVPDGGGSSPVQLTKVGGTLYFMASGGMWKSDGTAAGTVLVSNVHISVSQMTDVGGTLFFVGYTSAEGIELWKTDGTPAGTVLVKDIFPGVNFSSPAGLTNIGGTLFFTANNGTNGSQLWKSDGTTAGTVMVKNLSPNGFTSSTPNLANANGTLYFSAASASTQLWKSDGTSAGTVALTNVTGTGSSAQSSSSPPDPLAELGGAPFFFAQGSSGSGGLWKSDGTSAGTTPVFSVTSFDGAGLLTNLNDLLYFQLRITFNGGPTSRTAPARSEP